MSATTGPRDIDRKLHRIVREASTEYETAIQLARALERKRLAEFAYERSGETRYARAETIVDYVSFAKDCHLLDGDLVPNREKQDVRSSESFQHWLGDVVHKYLQVNDASLDDIRRVAETLLSRNPRQLPTMDNLYDPLKTPISRSHLAYSLRVLALLKPKTIRLRSRRLVILPGFMEV